MAAPRVTYQGRPGAYSHIAALAVFPGADALPCPTFEEALAAVQTGRAERAVIPVENSLAGRVADVHRLLPGSKLYVVGEHFLPIRHQLLGLAHATVDGLVEVRSHAHALSQCRRALGELGVREVASGDTAGAAEEVAVAGDPRVAAIASELAGQLHGLQVLRRDIEDAPNNTTRFLVMAAEALAVPVDAPETVTTFVFEVRSVPAALYKALGGFATNGVNITKIESYLAEDAFVAARFYLDIEGHPEHPPVARAMEELAFFSRELRVLGVYRRGALPDLCDIAVTR